MLTDVVDSFKQQCVGQSLGIFNYNSTSRGETRTMSAARSVSELLIVLVSEWLEGRRDEYHLMFIVIYYTGDITGIRNTLFIIFIALVLANCTASRLVLGLPGL